MSGTSYLASLYLAIFPCNTFGGLVWWSNILYYLFLGVFSLMIWRTSPPLRITCLNTSFGGLPPVASILMQHWMSCKFEYFRIWLRYLLRNGAPLHNDVALFQFFWWPVVLWIRPSGPDSLLNLSSSFFHKSAFCNMLQGSSIVLFLYLFGCFGFYSISYWAWDIYYWRMRSAGNIVWPAKGLLFEATPCFLLYIQTI